VIRADAAGLGLYRGRAEGFAPRHELGLVGVEELLLADLDANGQLDLVAATWMYSDDVVFLADPADGFRADAWHRVALVHESLGAKVR